VAMRVNGRPVMADAAIAALGSDADRSSVLSSGLVSDADGTRMEGLLSKRGLNGMWHERYFVFDGQTLVYYKHKPGSERRNR
jgi:hypothetical protein